jgi:predicted NUDIX family phosphoesterase
LDHEIILKVDDDLLRIFKSSYKDYCEFMEVNDESFEEYLAQQLLFSMKPHEDKSTDDKRKDLIVKLIRKHDGITPRQLHDMLTEIPESEGGFA